MTDDRPTSAPWFLERPGGPPRAERVPAALDAFRARTSLPPAGAPVVVGCSGGADSTALVLALADRGIAQHVVYVDHGLRAGTADEARRVHQLADAAQAGFAAVAVQVSRRGNLLGNARAVRYRALAGAARDLGTRFVAVAHTATDQLETVAFRAARGDPTHALAGMPEVRALDGDLFLLRPLLGAYRGDTAAFVAARGLQPIDDPTNARREFTRVRIREALLADPAEQARLADLAAAAAASLSADDEEARDLGPPEDLDAARVAAAAPGVLLRLLRRAGLHRAGHRHAAALRALAADAAGSRRLDLGGGLRAVRAYGRLSLRAGAPARDPIEVPDVALAIEGPGHYRLLDYTIEIRAIGEHRSGAPAGDVLDRIALSSTPVLRNLRPGDRWRASAGHRKLQDVLTDRKVPREARRGLILLAESERPGQVYWGLGLGPAPGWRCRPGHPGIQLIATPISDGDTAATDAVGG